MKRETQSFSERIGCVSYGEEETSEHDAGDGCSRESHGTIDRGTGNNLASSWDGEETSNEDKR